MLNETIVTAINNPECAILTGMTIGQIVVVKWLFTLVVAAALFKAVDKLGWTPLLNWFKSKIYKKSDVSLPEGKEE